MPELNITALTICPKPGDVEVRVGEGPLAHEGPLIATFMLREHADRFVAMMLPPPAPPAQVWRLKLGTRNFDFEAYGESQQDVERVMRSGLEVHAAHYPVQPFDEPGPCETVAGAWVREQMVDAVCYPVQAGTCSRDGSQIWPRS